MSELINYTIAKMFYPSTPYYTYESADACRIYEAISLHGLAGSHSFSQLRNAFLSQCIPLDNGRCAYPTVLISRFRTAYTQQKKAGLSTPALASAVELSQKKVVGAITGEEARSAQERRIFGLNLSTAPADESEQA